MATDSPGPGRPPRMSRDLRRAQVLRVAQELFTADGYHHVSMDDIADRAEVSKPVLYRHFPSKLDLYLTVVDERGADLIGAVDRAIATHAASAGAANPADARDAITAVVRAYLEFVDRTGEGAALIFESDVMHDPDIRARVERATDLVTERLERVLTRVAGPLDPAAAAVIAPCLAAIAQQAATRRLRTADAPSAERSAALVTRLVWGGVQGFLPGSVPAGPSLRSESL